MNKKGKSKMKNNLAKKIKIEIPESSVVVYTIYGVCTSIFAILMLLGYKIPSGSASIWIILASGIMLLSIGIGCLLKK